MTTPKERLAEIEKLEVPSGNPTYFQFSRREKEWLVDRVKRLESALQWIMPKVHQGNHEGDFETCMKSTCVEYRKALEGENENP